MKRLSLCLVLAAALMAGCKPNHPSENRGLPAEYTTAYLELYGHCYDSIPYGVCALDLYSDGLDIGDDNRIHGTGYNLYLSDIFVTDSLLEQGTYRSDTTARPFTFLPGRSFEGTPHGMYLLNIEDDRLLHIQLIDSGRFSWTGDTLALTLYFRNAYGTQVVYEPRCAATLIHTPKR